MTEAVAQTAPERQFSIQRIYSKDISFETPNSPAIFTQEWQPEINVNLNNSVTEIDAENIEVTLTVTVTAKVGDKIAYLAEATQSGIFLAQGIPEEEKGPMTGIYCPNILFPYVREVISDLVTRGSFPQFVLAPVNFEAIYAQRVQQQAPAEDQAH